MGLKFRLRGLAETFIDEICCPNCRSCSAEDDLFSTEYTRVTFDGIIVVVECRSCKEIFVPNSQRLGIVNPKALRDAVIKDCQQTGEQLLSNLDAVRMTAEKLNAERKGDLH